MSNAIRIAVNLTFIDSSVIKDVIEKAFEIEKMLNSLISKLTPQ
jgi:hypothetical protein